MKFKYNKKRRLFLAQSATQLGLLSAASLFNFKVQGQAALKKNIVFVHYEYSSLIPRKGEKKGEFHLGDGSRTTAPLKAYRNETMFVRDISVKFNGMGNAGHFPNHHAILTGIAGKGQTTELVGNANGPYDGISADILAGEELKKKYGTNTAHMNLAYSTHHPDKGGQVNNGFNFRTVSFRKGNNGRSNPVGPIKSPNQVFNSLNGSVNGSCTNVTTGGNTGNTQLRAQLNSQLRKAQIVANNLIDFKSSYLIPKAQYEKLESQAEEKIKGIERQISNIANDQPVVERVCTNISNPNIGEEAPENNYGAFQRKSNAFFDLIAASFQSNFCRSFTYYTSGFRSGLHSKAHENILNGNNLNAGGQQLAEHNEEIFKAVNSLIVKLKAAKVYDETMIVVISSFPHQHTADQPEERHRTDNMPFMVINSGKSGEYNRNTHGGAVHPGDAHVSLFSRLGLGINSFGSDQHSDTRRRGNNNKLIFG